MWVHEGDQFLISVQEKESADGKYEAGHITKIFTVKSVFGLYTTSIVGVKLVAEDGHRIVEENRDLLKLVEEGFVKPHKISKKHTRSY